METFNLTGGWITLNRACNMRCSHCYQQDTEFDPSKNATVSQIDQEIELFAQSGARSIVLIGGEPTVFPDLINTIKKIVSRNIVPLLVTNGRELSKPHKVKELVEGGLRDITVSIKAESEEGYRNVTHTKNSFERVVTAIKNLKSEPLIRLGTSVTVEQYFVDHAEGYIDFLLGLGVDHVNFDLGSPILKASGIDITNIPNPFVLASMVEMIHGRLKDTSLSYSFYMTIPLCIIDLEVKKDLVEGKRMSTSCHVPKGNAAIFSEDGSLLPCNHFTGISYGKLGKDFSDVKEFEVVLNSYEAQKFRKEFNSFPHSNCSTCADWKICGGGCKIKWMHYDPKDYIGKQRGHDYVKTSRLFPIVLQR